MVVSALINAFKIVGKDFATAKFVVNGAGAAGQAITRLIHSAGGRNIILCDSRGAIYEGRPNGMNPYKDDIARITNPSHEAGPLNAVIRKADVFIGVSVAGCVTQDMVRTMAPNAIVMGMANPEPEILPHLAKKPEQESSARAAPTSPIRSITSWPSRASSAALWTYRPAPSTRK